MVARIAAHRTTGVAHRLPVRVTHPASSIRTAAEESMGKRDIDRERSDAADHQQNDDADESGRVDRKRG